MGDAKVTDCCATDCIANKSGSCSLPGVNITEDFECEQYEEADNEDED